MGPHRFSDPGGCLASPIRNSFHFTANWQRLLKGEQFPKTSFLMLSRCGLCFPGVLGRQQSSCFPLQLVRTSVILMISFLPALLANYSWMELRCWVVKLTNNQVFCELFFLPFPSTFLEFLFIRNEVSSRYWDCEHGVGMHHLHWVCFDALHVGFWKTSCIVWSIIIPLLWCKIVCVGKGESF